MQVGIDSYSYHRLYGEIRAGEEVPRQEPWPFVAQPVLEHARHLNVDAVFLETCYLPEPEVVDSALLNAGGLSLGFSWGHAWPSGRFHGLDGGRSPAAEEELARWIEAAADLGQPVMRITLGSPVSRGTEPAARLVARLIEPVRRAADRAADRGLALAIENHGDLRAEELLEVIERAGRPNLGVTLDNVNLIRVGDDMLGGATLLAPRTLLVQLKDHLSGDPTISGGPVCTALGEGIADLHGIVEVLHAVGFAGPVCVELASLGGGEVDELTMIERSVAWLRRHLAA